MVRERRNDKAGQIAILQKSVCPHIVIKYISFCFSPSLRPSGLSLSLSLSRRNPFTMECKLCKKEDEILIGDLCSACSSKKKCSHCSVPHDGKWSFIDSCDKCALKNLIKTDKKELLEHRGCIGCNKTMDPGDLIKGICAKCIIAQSRNDESASEAPGGDMNRNGPSKASDLQNLSKDSTTEQQTLSMSSKCNGCNSPKDPSDLKGGLCIGCLFDKLQDQKLGSPMLPMRLERKFLTL